MAAVHQLQAPVVERLDADRQPVYARFAQPVEVIFRQVVGVGLEGGFRGAGAVEQQRGMIQQSFQRGGCVERRRAAAEIAGRDRFAAQVILPFVQFAVHGGRYAVHLLQPGALVEVAVGADAFAERYVEIKPGHGLSEFPGSRSFRRIAGECLYRLYGFPSVSVERKYSPRHVIPRVVDQGPPDFVASPPQDQQVAVQKGDALSVYGLQITLIVVFDPPSPVGQQFPYLLFQSVVLPGERDTLEFQFPALDRIEGKAGAE